MALSSAVAATSTSPIDQGQLASPPAQHHPRDGVTITWFVLLGVGVLLFGTIAMIRYKMRIVVGLRERERIPSSMGSQLDRAFPVIQPVTLTERRRQGELFNSDDRPLMDEVWIRPPYLQQDVMSVAKARKADVLRHLN